MYMFLTSLVSVVLTSGMPFMGNDPRNPQGHYNAVLHHLCRTVRGEMAIVDFLVGVQFLFGCSMFTASPSVVALTVPQTSGVLLSVFTTTVRFVRCRQHSRQQPP